MLRGLLFESFYDLLFSIFFTYPKVLQFLMQRSKVPIKMLKKVFMGKFRAQRKELSMPVSSSIPLELVLISFTNTTGERS